MALIDLAATELGPALIVDFDAVPTMAEAIARAAGKRSDDGEWWRTGDVCRMERVVVLDDPPLLAAGDPERGALHRGEAEELASC